MDRLFSRERTRYGGLAYHFRVKLKDSEAEAIRQLIQDVYQIGIASYYKYYEIRVTDAKPLDEEMLRRLDVEIVAVLAYHLREQE